MRSCWSPRWPPSPWSRSRSSPSPPGCSTSPQRRPRWRPAGRSTGAATRSSTPATAASWGWWSPKRPRRRSRSGGSRGGLQEATIAIEDQRFYQHGALDPEGILRAALKDLEAGKAVEGGSTITQQLVRNLCIRRPARNLERKIVEAKLAIEYAQKHSRREILGQYLNTASYGTVVGSTAIGVQAASRFYFSRPVWGLSLEQEALLAGLPQAPSQYNPLLHPGAARVRRNEVLGKMAALGYVSRPRPRRGRSGAASS